VKLQSRDEQILKLCYEQQFLSARQVQTHFFDGSQPNASRRMILLTEAGFVRHIPESERVLGRLYHLTGRGVQVAKELVPHNVPQRRRFSIATMPHDLLVTDVRLRLSHFWDGLWIPERAIRASEYEQIPDGLMLFRSGRKIAIELENSIKSKRRYQQILPRWTGTNTFLVLYVATSAVLAVRLKSILRDAPRGAAYGLVEWEQLRSGGPLVWTPRGEADLLARREF
jgi:hypothetical protein